MTVEELIARLQEFDGDAEVRFLMQPSYPFEYSIAGLAQIRYREDEEAGELIPQIDNGGDADQIPVVYITEGSQLGYGHRDIFDLAR